MTFDEYQRQAIQTAIHKDKDFWRSAVYRTLGLVGEAGEVAEKMKKIIRDKNGKISDEDKNEIVKEMGDVLWYLQALADYLDVPFEDVAKVNLEKLSSRKNRGKIQGSGDNR
jgi:NTP pyrophosphatase (non-canonical NTP hydrolase)